MHGLGDYYEILGGHRYTVIKTSDVAAAFTVILHRTQCLNTPAHEIRRRFGLGKQRKARAEHYRRILSVNGDNPMEVGLRYLQQVLLAFAVRPRHSQQLGCRSESRDVERRYDDVGPIAEVRYESERFGRYF